MAKAVKFLFLILLVLFGALIIYSSSLLQQTSYTMLAFGVAVLLAGAIYFIFNEFTVMNFLFLSPLIFLRPSFYYDVVFVVALLVIFLVQFLHKPGIKKLNIYYFWFFAILLVAGIRSYLFGIRGDKALIYFFTECLMPILVFQIIANSDVTWQDIRRFLKYHVYMAALLGFIGIVVAVMNPAERIGSLWSNAMTINGYYVMAFFLGIGLMDKENHHKRLLLSILIVIILLGMIFTYTRIVLVGLIFGLVIMSFRRPKLFLYLIPLFMLIPVLLPGELVSRFQLLLKGDISIFVRLLVWYYSIQMIQDSPFWGMGFDSFIVRYTNLMPVVELRSIHSHNVYLKLILEMGLIGFLAYMGVIFSVLKKGFIALKKTKGLSLTFILWVTLLVELIFCLSDVFIAHVAVSLMFWILVALMYKISEMKPEIAAPDDGSPYEIVA